MGTYVPLVSKSPAYAGSDMSSTSGIEAISRSNARRGIMEVYGTRKLQPEERSPWLTGSQVLKANDLLRRSSNQSASFLQSTRTRHDVPRGRIHTQNLSIV
jgi:hypothetical protein